MGSGLAATRRVRDAAQRQLAAAVLELVEVGAGRPRRELQLLLEEDLVGEIQRRYSGDIAEV